MNLCMVAHLWSTNIFGYDKLWGPSQRVVTLLLFVDHFVCACVRALVVFLSVCFAFKDIILSRALRLHVCLWQKVAA